MNDVSVTDIVCRGPECGKDHEREHDAISDVREPRELAIRPALLVGHGRPALAGVYKRLGEFYEEKGDTAKAMTYYAKFVELWKNADAELQPKVTEVRARLARLQAKEKR